MHTKLKIFINLLFLTFSVAQQQIPDDEVVDYIKKAGYRGEAFQVTTEDGYILSVHHMFPKISSGYKKPVFLMHSAFSNPLYWLNSGKNISLGYLLSDNGYDVWFGNVRGSKYATAHKWLPVNGKDYWRFDFHEMGVYDLPPMINLALQRTGANQVFYVGHSQACPSLLALLAIRPEWNKKIAQSHLLAPVANMMHIRPSLKPLLPVFLTFINTFKNFTVVDLTPFLGFGTNLSNFLCTTGIRLTICQLFQFLMIGGIPLMSVTDPEVYRVIIPSLSPKIATQQVTHYAQNIALGDFYLFDYGAEKNLKLYGSKTPPLYPLKNVVSPVYLWASDTDFLNTFKDAQTIVPRLPNVKWRPIRGYNHIDFIYARNARQIIYGPILHEFEKSNYVY